MAPSSSTIFLSVSYVVGGGVLLYKLTRPGYKKSEYTSVGDSPLTRDFTKPRIDRGKVLSASVYILIGLFGLMIFVAEHWKTR